MKTLSNGFATLMGIIFILVGVTFLVCINIQAKFEYVLPADLNFAGFFIVIILLLIRYKTVYFDQTKLYYKTLFFTPLHEIEYTEILNIVKVSSLNILQPVYKVIFYNKEGNLKTIYFIKSIMFLGDDLFDIFGIANPNDQYFKNPD